MGDHTGDLRANTDPGVIKFTKAGWLYIAVTLFLGFSAVNTANNLVYLIVAAFLSFMGISGFFGRRNLSKINIALQLPDEIYARADFPLRISLTNNRRFLPVFLLNVHLSGHNILFPFVDAKAKASKFITFSFNERGLFRIREIRISSVFPFNFFIRYRRIDIVLETTVFPQPKKCSLPDLFEKQRKPRGEKITDKTGYEDEMVSMRDYIKGDPLKYIHWKASAKTGQLKTRELASLSHQPVIIDFDSVAIKNLEEKLSCLTYVIVKLFSQNVPVGLRMGGALFTSLGKTHGEQIRAGKITMLKMLALYGKD